MMADLFAPLLINLIVGTAVWVYSVKQANVNVVDSLWSLMFWFASLYWFLKLPEHNFKHWLVITLVTLWAWRLSIYLMIRNWGKAEDGRYQMIRANHQPGFWWKSIYIIFALQAVLAWIASIAIFAALSTGDKIGVLDILGISLWLVGIFFEVVGDHQLAQFKRRGSSSDVMNSGLWRYTRHPNYFGEFCIWWGVFLLALSAHTWWAVISPVLMSVLLLRVSGVTMLESTITERRPGYRNYILQTNAFFPWFPKSATARANQAESREG